MMERESCAVSITLYARPQHRKRRWSRDFCSQWSVGGRRTDRWRGRFSQQISRHRQAAPAGRTATGTHGQFTQRTASGRDRVADITFGDAIAHTYVHDRNRCYIIDTYTLHK